MGWANWVRLPEMIFLVHALLDGRASIISTWPDVPVAVAVAVAEGVSEAEGRVEVMLAGNPSAHASIFKR